MADLDDLRTRLDAIDRGIAQALRDRLDTVADIARVKREGLDFLRDHERESQLLNNIEATARELALDPFRTREIFREVVAMSLKAQEEALLERRRAEAGERQAHRVAFQGTEGSYSQLAARKYFAERAGEMQFEGHDSFAEALAAVESGAAGYALLPIENTTAGSINQTYELLRGTHLAIIGEEVLHIRHCLAAPRMIEASRLRKVLSHPQALAQCSRFLASLNAEVVAYRDTAAAAREVRDTDDSGVAAIASEAAAGIYGLEIVARDIADQPENWTRFVVVSALRIEPDRRIPSKISLLLTTPHRHGALAHCLEVLSRHGLNLCKLESRPEPRRPWEYLFYVDVEGHVADDGASRALAQLRRECPYFKVLGCYPARTTSDGAVDRMERTS
jgi:chorismate mutase/prephenate dehydratase